MDNISISIVLDSKPLKNGLYSLYLQLIKGRKVKRLSLGIKANKEHFRNGRLSRSHKNFKADNEFLIKIENEAHEAHRQLRIENANYSLDELIAKIKGQPRTGNIGLIQLINSITKVLEESGRMGYAKVNNDTSNSLKKFLDKDIPISEVNKDFLEGYEAFMRKRGNKSSSIGIKMRQIRAAINKAIERGNLDELKNPFKLYKVSKLKSKPKKTALSLEEMRRFANVDLSNHKTLIEAHDYFMFSFFARGINFFDLIQIKNEDIQNDRLYYTRSKTKGEFNIGLNNQAMKLIKKYEDSNPTDYLFPVLNKPNMTPQQVKNRRHKVSSRINIKLKQIAKLAGINENLHFYVARHTYGTNLRYADVSPDKISEMMGHSDIKVTMGYLKDFRPEELDQKSEELFKLL